MKKFKRAISSILVVVIMLSTIVSVMPIMSSASDGIIQKISVLRRKFPDGKFWNHYTNSNHNHNGYGGSCTNPNCNNPDGYTSSPCSSHSSTLGVGKYDCNNFDGGIQCMGFANKVFYDIFGVKASAQAKRYDRENIVVGDWIRVNDNSHSAVVIGRSGNTLTVVEANLGTSSTYCKIRWDKTYSISSVSYYKHASNYDSINGQSIKYESINTGKYYLKNAATGKYLIVDAGKDAEKQNISVWTKTDGAKEMIFNVISTSNGYKMQPLISSTRVVNPYAWTVTGGVNVNLYTDDGSSSQSWKFQSASGGGYYIRNAQNTGVVLDVNGSGNVLVENYHGGKSQIWYLEPYSDHKHSYSSKTTKPATCTETGIKTFSCSCGNSYTESIPATGHTPGSWFVTQKPTYLVKGIEIQKCNVCGMQINQREIDKVAYINKYTDVKDSAWYAGDVEFVVKRGYMVGTTETTFNPNGNLTREQFIMVLARYSGAELSNFASATGFSDVPEGKWYSSAIQWAKKRGFTEGVGNGKFGLGESVTREQVSKFLYSFAELKGRDVSGKADISSFVDCENVSSWAKVSVEWAVSKGIIGSTSTSKLVLSPKNITTRAQCAKMFTVFERTK